MEKTIVKQLEEAQTTIAAQAEQLKATEAAKAEAVTALETAKVEHAAALEKLNADVTVARNELAQEITAHGGTKEDLKKARHALANPAFADAGARGEAAPTPEGGSAPVAPPMTQKEALAAYEKIEGAVERAAFRSAHAKELGIA